MGINLGEYLVVGVSSRALFDLEEENRIFEQEGLDSYAEYQHLHESDILKPGSGFQLVKALQRINECMPGKRRAEIIIMSKNSADTCLRIMNSIKHYNLDITRFALTGGAALSPYLPAFKTDLFLSANFEDVQIAVNSGIASGQIITSQDYSYNPDLIIDQIRIAFDGDAVLFSDESEKIYQNQGLEAFLDHERINAKKPLPEGPFAKLLKTLSNIQKEFKDSPPPIRTALVTARNAPAHERVIRTLRAWDVRIDEVFFLGGMEKTEVLDAFGAHIFFDDQPIHVKPASTHVPSAQVPYRNREDNQ